MPQLCPFHFGTHLLGNNFYLQPCWMRCSISTSQELSRAMGKKKKKRRLFNGEYHCKAQMIYNTALWLLYHVLSGNPTFLTHCPLTHTMEQYLQSILFQLTVPTLIPRFQRRGGVLNSLDILLNNVGSGIFAPVE